MEISFKKIPDMTDGEQLDISSQILRAQNQSQSEGEPKEMAIIDPKYIDELDLLLYPKDFHLQNSIYTYWHIVPEG